MKDSRLLVGTILVFLVIVISWIGVRLANGNSSGTSKATVSSAILILPETTYDFGTLNMKNGPVEHIFTAKNESNDEVTVKKVYTSCMCTAATILKDGQSLGRFGMQSSDKKLDIRIGAQESITIKAGFDPAAHGPSGVGLAQRSIFLETNSTAQSKIELTFRAVVINS